MTKHLISSRLEMAKWAVLVSWGLSFLYYREDPNFIEISRNLNVFPTLVAVLAVGQYYFLQEEEKLKVMKRVPYFLLIGLLFFLFTNWHKRTYVEPRAKAVMQQHMRQSK